VVISKFKTGVLGLAVAVSGVSFAQAVKAPKPTLRAPVEARPVAERPSARIEVESESKGTASPSAASAAGSSAAEKLNLRGKLAPVNDNKVVISLPIQTQTTGENDQKSCGTPELAQTVANGTGLSYSTTVAAIDYWSKKGNLNAIGSCQVALGGLGAFNAAARINFVKMLDYGMQIQQQNPSTPTLEALGEGLAKAKNEYNTLKPTTVSVEIGTVRNLQEHCGIFRNLQASL
jgi:hypothetical protein